MVFTKALAIKVLGGLAVCTGVALGGVKLLGKSGNKDQGASNPTNQDTQGDSQRTAGDNNSPNSQPTENPAEDGVNSNKGNPQTLQNPSAADGNSPAQTSSQPQQNSQKPGSEEGTDPGSSGGDRVDPQTPSGTEGNPQPLQTKPTNNTAGRSGTGAPSEADKSITNSGLKCTVDTSNNKIGLCTGITEGKTINVKWEDGTKREGINSLTIPDGAKIKYEKYVADGDYKNYLKISIEGGDIALTGGTPETITKLEQFETYEIKEEGIGQDKKYYLSRKTTIFDHKIKLLNIPKTCQLVTSETETSCTLTSDELKKIKFEGRSSDPSVVGGKTASLTILKTDDSEFADQKYKFILKTDHKIVISGGSGTSSNDIISNTNTEFKIKKSGTDLTLEKAWNLDSLAAKIGLTDCNTDSNDCTLPGTINVSNGESDKIKDAKITATNLKIKFLQDQPNHNQGFKFNTPSDINLTEGNPAADNKKIESNGTYEIKKIENEWYLSKVTESK